MADEERISSAEKVVNDPPPPTTEMQQMVRTGPASLLDFRLQWLTAKITDLLGIEDVKYAEEMVSEHSVEFQAFFDEEIVCYDDIAKQIVFLWRTYYDKMIETTVTVLEEVRPTTPPVKPPARRGQKKGKKATTEPVEVRPPSPVYRAVEV